MAASKPEAKAKVAKAPKGAEPSRIKTIVRLAETNLDGEKKVEAAIRNIKGVSFMFANAVSDVSGFREKTLESLSEQEQKTLEDMLTNPQKYNIPMWLYNRKKDPATGQARHLIVSNLDLTTKMDINEMKKIRSYKGVRHGLGLPVRGQRTRSSFRTGRTVGVKREKKLPAKAEGK